MVAASDFVDVGIIDGAFDHFRRDTFLAQFLPEEATAARAVGLTVLDPERGELLIIDIATVFESLEGGFDGFLFMLSLAQLLGEFPF